MRIKTLIIVLCIGLELLLFMGLLGIILIESQTIEKVGIEQVPCIDEKGNPFKDELCNETIYCSKFGAIVENKCSEINIEENK